MAQKHAKTELGIEENVEGLLCYVLGFITGIVFLIIEKKSKFVKFHALQSTITFAALWIVALIFGVIPFIGWIIAWILWVVSLILWIVLMVKAYQGEKWKVLIAGDIAEKSVK